MHIVACVCPTHTHTKKGRRSGKRGQEGRNEGTDGGKRKKMPVTSIKIREFLAVFCPLNFT